MKCVRKLTCFTVVQSALFFSIFIPLTTPRLRKVINLAVIHPVGLYLVKSCSSRDSASGSIVFITYVFN